MRSHQRPGTEPDLSKETETWLELLGLDAIATDSTRSPEERDGARLYYRFLVDRLPTSRDA